MSIRVIAVDNSEELLEKITRILKEMDDVEFCGRFGGGIAAVSSGTGDSICERESGGHCVFRCGDAGYQRHHAGSQDLSASGSAGGRAAVRNTGIFPGGMEDPCIRIYY